MTKKIFILTLILCPTFAFGQKTAYLYSDSVLKSITEYGVKITKLDSTRQAYSKEIESGSAALQGRYDALTAPYAPKKDETLDNLKKRMSIADTLRLSLLDKEIKQWQEKKNIYERLLQNSYNQDIQPILTKVSNVISEYARLNGFSAVYSFEQIRAALLYVDPKTNITDAIIRKLKQK